jgi:hypothetical protein
MMAKMFYTLEETKAALGKNEEEIKQFAREGRLREFRDGPRLMFKADQVEALKNELGLGGANMADMGPSDSGGPIGLVDSHGGSGTGISLVDTDAGARSGEGMQLKDDTALAGDLSLGGSMGGVPSPGRPGSSSGSLAGSVSGSGINVLGDSVAPADPMAQTAISTGSMTDQVSLEGVGSGSGLLDLTRESDDTSLGAELLDEISPGGSKRGTKAGSGAMGGTGMGGTGMGGTGMGGTGMGGSRAGSAAGGSALAGSGAGDSASGGTAVAAPAIGGRRGAVQVDIHEKPDALAPALGGAALGAAAVLVFGGFVLGSGVLDTHPDVLDNFKGYSVFILAAGMLGVAVVGAVAGAVLDKVGGR